MNATQGLFHAPQALLGRYTASLSAAPLSAVQRQWLQDAVEDQPADATARVFNLFLSRHGSRAVLWAGALLLREDDMPGSEVFLFSPLGSLERFANEAALRQALEQRLDDGVQQAQLLHFTPVDVRPLLKQAGELTLQTQPVPAPVMQHTSQAITDYLTRCREETLASLVAAPSLRSVLDTQLRTALGREFPGVQIDLQGVWVRSSQPVDHPTRTADVITTSLSSVALDFYLKGQLPAQGTREFVGLLVSDAEAPVEPRMVRVLQMATGQLATRIQTALDAYWQASSGAQPSPHDYCVARQGDLFYQQGLQALHDQRITREQFDLLQLLGADADYSPRVRAAQLSVFDPDRGEVPLCGLFCVFFPGRNAPVFSFGGLQGLIRHDSRDHLKTWVLSRLRDTALFETLAPYIAADQHEFITAMAEPRLSIENVSTDVFDVCMQSIRARQASDLSLLLKQYRAGRVALAGVDHALDVRELVDQGLLVLNNQRRWSSRFVPGAYKLRSAPFGNGNGNQASQLNLKLPKLEVQRDELLRDWPTPRSFARLRLTALLARAGHGHLEAAGVVIQTFAADVQLPGASPERTVTLEDALLERVTGDQSLATNPAFVQAAVRASQGDELKPLRTLAGTKVLRLLDQGAADFCMLYIQHLRRFFFTPYSPQGPDALLLRLATLRMALLRADLRLMRLENGLSPGDSAVIANVLVHPVSQQRPAHDQFVPDVHGLALSFNGALGTLALANCLLFTERGGLESDNAGRAIIWTPAVGFEGFESLDRCTAQLEARLLDKARRWELLAHLNAAEQERVATNLDGTLDWKAAGQNRWFYCERIEQDFTQQAQNTAIDKVLADADFVCRTALQTPLSAQAFENLAQTLLVQGRAGVRLERVLATTRLHLFKSQLPDWLKTAGADDQRDYAHLLQRYRLAGHGDQNYLHGIPQISAFASALLTLRLDTDFPGLGLEPDEIEVAIDTYLPAPVALGETPSFLPAATSRSLYTLTQFALAGYAQLNADAVFVRAMDNSELPLGLNADYVRVRSRQLDIGAHYQALLRARLAPESDEGEARLQQFAEHLGLQVMEQALREKLIDPRRETVYRYLRQVFQMPDGTARPPVDGVTVIIRPLELIAEPGSEPDRVSGVYLIGPQASDAGPQILWANYSEQLTFRVYENDAGLLEQLRNDTTLQALILPRIAPYARKIYDNGGFVEPHLPRYTGSPEVVLLSRPAAPTLASRPIAGNLYKVLYKDNYQLLLDMAAAQSTTTAQADWESFKYLMSLFAQSALMFLPAKLSIPLVVWQSLGALRAGVDAAKKGQWGEAVGDFAMALIMLAGSFHEEKKPQKPPPRLVQSPAGAVIPAVQLTPEQQTGLLPFRANDVSLMDLQLEPDTHFYRDPVSGFAYVPLGGQLFRLKAWRDRWRIFIGEEREGPLVKLNEYRQWMLDTLEPLLGGGPVMSRSIMSTYFFTYEINAVGMESIQRRSPLNAMRIREAHGLAVTYLLRCQTALHTLNEPGLKNARNRRLLEGFFDVEALDRAMLDRVRQSVEPMLARFMHPDMAPQTSSKYISCRARFTDDTVAFVNVGDPGKMVYLTDHFFETMFERNHPLGNTFLKPSALAFGVNQHYRASFLMHEITHQVLKTEDIFYLNPGFPYADLLNGQTTFGRGLKNFVESLQVAHSPRITQEYLFKDFNHETRQWTDLTSGPAKRRVKAITGAKTLAQAREVFVNDPMKRIDVMLANADTVVLLVNQLGRVFPVLREPVFM